MPFVNLPPYAEDQDQDRWQLEMTQSNNEIDDQVNNTISVATLQTIVAASTSFADFQTRIAAL